jgi:hypothetical protein
MRPPQPQQASEMGSQFLFHNPIRWKEKKDFYKAVPCFISKTENEIIFRISVLEMERPRSLLPFFLFHFRDSDFFFFGNWKWNLSIYGWVGHR